MWADPTAWIGRASALFDCADRDNGRIAIVGQRSCLASFAARRTDGGVGQTAGVATMFRYHVLGVRVKVFLA
jgi:hypothetical protein